MGFGETAEGEEGESSAVVGFLIGGSEGEGMRGVAEAGTEVFWGTSI